jgi:hypothetical protein
MLDYATPLEPAPRRDLAAVRFTSGAGLVVLALLAAGAWGGDDMVCCSAIGAMVEIAIIAAVFTAGRWLCQRWRAGPMVERNPIATIVGGMVLSGMFLGVLGSLELVMRISPQRAAGIALLAYLVAIGASPWWVYRAIPDPALGA